MLNNITIDNGTRESLETGLQKLQSGTVSVRGGVVVHWEQIVVSLAPTLTLRQPESLRSPGIV